MVLIYVRHSKDDDSDPTHRNDPHLTSEGKTLAYKRGRKLISKHGLPQIIYCSPFQRTRETLRYMLYHVDRDQLATIKIIYDTNLSRFFPNKEKVDASVAETTGKAALPIYETRSDFADRVATMADNMNHWINSDKIVWCITHTTVYKRLSKIYDIEIPKYIPYMHSFALEPEVSIIDEMKRSTPPPIIEHTVDKKRHKKVCKNCGKIH
jgi:broad specificity phosphatase PhoE